MSGSGSERGSSEPDSDVEEENARVNAVWDKLFPKQSPPPAKAEPKKSYARLKTPEPDSSEESDSEYRDADLTEPVPVPVAAVTISEIMTQRVTVQLNRVDVNCPAVASTYRGMALRPKRGTKECIECISA